MTGDAGATDPPAEDQGALSLAQLRGLQYGVAATIMPVATGWRLHYYSAPSFAEEPGTDFCSLEEAIVAMTEVLAAMNTDEEKLRANAELADRLGLSRRGIPEDHAVE